MFDEVMRLLLLTDEVSSAAGMDALAEVDSCVIDPCMAVADALSALGRGSYDAVVVTAAVAADQAALQRLRAAAGDVAFVVLQTCPEDAVPLEPRDVGIQSTLDAWPLDGRTLTLTLQLAVERQRLAVSEELARAQAEALSRSRARDPLTGLPFGERLLEEIDLFVADAVRFARPFTVAAVELDVLPQVRTERGDGLADCLLIHAAGIMDHCLRTSDLLGRLVDDQFLVAMPGTSGEAGMKAARRIQSALTANPYRAASTEHPVEVSMGLASLSGLMAVDELVFRADGALEVAQRSAPGGLHLGSTLLVR